jgi:hypothetical protein
LNTAGSIMPEPRISSHPEALQTRQVCPVFIDPLPPHMTHWISISALGSVNGKKLGRKRTPASR